MMNSQHGGPRKGAGRKPQRGKPKKKIGVAIDPDLLARIDNKAEATDTPRNALIEAALLKEYPEEPST